MPARRPSPRSGAFVLAGALALAAPRAGQAELRGSSTTIFRVYDVHHSYEQTEKVRTYRPIDQLLRLTWDELGERKAWSFDVQLRGRTDLATGQRGGEDELQVLIARAEWSSPGRVLDLTLGRQWAITGLGWRAYDGARLDFRKLRHAKFFVFAGLPVEHAESSWPDADGLAWGAGATFVAPSVGSFGFDYEVRREEGIRLEETAGVDLHFELGSFDVSANADYSILQARFGETAVLVRKHWRHRHVAEARVTRVQPIFPPDSIFAVFTSNPYTERRLSYEYRGPGRFSVGGYVSSDQYEDTGFDGPEDIDRAAATLRIDGPRASVHRSEIGWQSGFSGKRLALRHDVDWSVTPRIRVGAGASTGRYENAYRLTEEDSLHALRARASYDHFGRWDLAASLEQYFGRDRDTLRGTLTFRTKLGAARRERPWWGGAWNDHWAGGVEPRISDRPRDAASGGEGESR